MGFLRSQKGNISLKVKFGLFVFILILGFALLDVGPLKGLYDLIKYTHIEESQLNQVRQRLYNIYLLKALWVVVLSGIAVGFGFWILLPYRKLLEKISHNLSKKNDR